MSKTDKEYIIRLACRYYQKRQAMISKGGKTQGVLMLCLVMNQAVDDAIAEAYQKMSFFAPNFSEVIRTDIAECRGYAKSPLSSVMCDGSYKKYKSMVKNGIATRLGL